MAKQDLKEAAMKKGDWFVKLEIWDGASPLCQTISIS
jgi:hypothetical protein